MSHYKQVGWELKNFGDTALTADYNNIAKTKNTGIFLFYFKHTKKQYTIQNAQVIFTSNFIKLCFLGGNLATQVLFLSTAGMHSNIDLSTYKLSQIFYL